MDSRSRIMDSWSPLVDSWTSAVNWNYGQQV